MPILTDIKFGKLKAGMVHRLNLIFLFFFSQKYLMDKARHYKPVSVVSRKVGQDRIEVALSA